MNLWTAKITAHASVFSYWKHVKAVATKGKSNPLLPESEPLQEPQGDLGHIRHGQSHQPTALMLPRGPTPDGHFSASWALGHELPWEQRSSNLSGSCTWARRIANVSGLPTHPECSLLTLNGKSKVKSNVLNWKLRNVEQQLNFYGPVHVDTRTWLGLKISPGVSIAPAVPTHSNLHCPVWPAPTLQSLLLRYNNNVRLTPVTEKRCETGKQFSTTVLRTFYELGNLPGTWNSKMHRI